MADKAGIIQAIQQITGTRMTDKVYLAACEVDSVDAMARTIHCTGIDGKTQAKFIDVQLMAEVDDGELKIPTIGSTVIIGYSERVLPFVIMYSELDKIIYFGGELGGMVKVIDLTKKINNLENKVNDLINIFNAHVHTGVQTGGGSSAVTPTIVTGNLIITAQNEIENLNIKQ